MKRALSRTLALIGFGLATFAVTPIHAQTTANGPYYATPSWDQQLPAATRFIVLANWGSAAVLDRETGLVWERSPSTEPQGWRFALLRCTAKDVGNRKGWRLPTIQELATLIDPSQSNPALPVGHPFINVQHSDYWSANTNVQNATFGLGARFNDGSLFEFGSKSDSNFVWCVRGGQGIDPQ